MADDENKDLTEQEQQRLKDFLENVPPDVLEILENLDDEDSSTRVKITREFSRSFSGPLPPPEALRDYDRIEPGFADRIVTMAENEQTHRHDTEGIALSSSVSAEKRGQYLAFGLCGMIVVGSIYLIAAGFQISGLLLAGGTLSSLAYVFISGRKQSENVNRDENNNTE